MVDSGALLIGVALQKNLFTLSLKKLLARKRGNWRDVPAFSSPSDGAQKGMPDKPPFQPGGGGALFPQSEIDQFWDKWNYLVNERNCEFRKKRPDKRVIIESMQKSNLLMANCPNTRLRRIDRLAQLLVDTPLDAPSSCIYAECGETEPYVGQFGCIVEPRAPSARHFEHGGRSKTVQNHFVRKRQKFRPAKQGKLPSLARAMGMNGPGGFTIRLLQEMPPSSTITSRANAAEKHWDCLLGPTLYSRTPFGGAHRLNWEILLHNKLDRPETASLKDRVLLMVQGGAEHPSPEDLLLLLSVCDKHVAPERFSKLFQQLSGRVRKEWGVILRHPWVIRLPCPEEEVCTRITKLCRQAVTGMTKSMA